MKPILTILLLLFSGSLVAQTVSTKYEWEAKPKPHDITSAEASNSVIGLKDQRILEYAFDSKGQMAMYYTRHVIAKVNTQEGIEQFNKIYIPVGGVIEIGKLKARSVSKDGKVTVLDKNDIKSSDNVESKGDYKHFAMEGLEPGSEVEYLYTLKYDINLYGNEKLQAGYPKKNVGFDLYAPENLIFLLKSYNGLQEMQEDTAYENGRHWFLKVDHIHALREEQFAAYGANLQRVEYTIAYNAATGDKRILDWAGASTAFFKDYFEAESKEINEVEKFVKKMDLKGSNDKEKVRFIDNYLKANIAVQNVGNPDFVDLKKIISDKVANNRGMTRLYIQVLEQMKYMPELVLTTDRHNVLFDGSFQTWNYFDEVLLYIPSLDMYLAPHDFTARNGLAPSECEGNDGLFIKKVSVGDLTSGAGKVKRIAESEWKLNRHDEYAEIRLAEPFDEATVKARYIYMGHAAEFIQAYYDFLNEEQIKQFLEPVVQFMGEDSKISNLKITNQLHETVEGHPFVIESDVNISSLIEKAGNKVLLKIGNVIGPQVEMYSEDERQNDIENEFNRGYHREITLTIPDGYQVKNLEALNLNVDMTVGSETPCFFRSSYTVEGKVVKVVIDEQYMKLRFPKSEYEPFRKVVNAAADWNKVVLVLEKVGG